MLLGLFITVKLFQTILERALFHLWQIFIAKTKKKGTKIIISQCFGNNFHDGIEKADQIQRIIGETNGFFSGTKSINGRRKFA